MAEVWTLDATTIASSVASGALSATEVVESVLGQVDRWDGDLHAYCTVRDAVVEEARALDKRVAAGDPVGPLAGVPIGVKDVVFTEGTTTAGCCSAFADLVPESDDPVVARLRAADALILGKTTTSELAYGPGLTPFSPQASNPWNVALSPGNSSSGSAAAVAAGLATMGVGTDGGGSIRCPASFCGIFGLKPSRGRVPHFRDPSYPGLSSWHSLGTAGPMTRTVADAALMMSVISGPDARDLWSLPSEDVSWTSATDRPGLRGVRVGFSEDFGYASVDPEVRDVFRRALETLQDELGAELRPVGAPWGDISPTMDVLIAADSDLGAMRRMQREQGPFRSPSVRALLEREWTAEELTGALAARNAISAHMARTMEEIDVLVTPTVAVLPFSLTEVGPRAADGSVVDLSAWCPFTQVANVTGQPAASVPAGLSSSGLPVGIQFIGQRFADLAVLTVSAAFEAAGPWTIPWPPMTQAPHSGHAETSAEQRN